MNNDLTHPLGYSFNITKGHIVIYSLICSKLRVGIFLKTTFLILKLSFLTLVCIYLDIHMKAIIVIRIKRLVFY